MQPPEHFACSSALGSDMAPESGMEYSVPLAAGFTGNNSW